MAKPSPPFKHRLLLLLPLIPSVLAVLLLVMLIVDKPFPFVNRPMCKVWYEGGTIAYAGVTPGVWIGPSAQTVDGPYGLVYKNFREKVAWENALPRRRFAHLGVEYSSTPHAREEGTNFVADRWRQSRIGAEYSLP